MASAENLDNLSDHDLLIAHSGKIDSLCVLMRVNNGHLKEFNRNLVDRCAHNHKALAATHKEIFGKIDKKVDTGTVKWIVGVAVLLVICVAGLVGPQLAYIPAQGEAIEQLETTLEKIQETHIHQYYIPPQDGEGVASGLRAR
jgi:hypothetical protein